MILVIRLKETFDKSQIIFSEIAGTVTLSSSEQSFLQKHGAVPLPYQNTKQPGAGRAADMATTDECVGPATVKFVVFISMGHSYTMHARTRAFSAHAMYIASCT